MVFITLSPSKHGLKWDLKAYKLEGGVVGYTRKTIKKIYAKIFVFCDHTARCGKWWIWLLAKSAWPSSPSKCVSGDHRSVYHEFHDERGEAGGVPRAGWPEDRVALAGRVLLVLAQLLGPLRAQERGNSLVPGAIINNFEYNKIGMFMFHKTKVYM